MLSVKKDGKCINLFTKNNRHYQYFNNNLKNSSEELNRVRTIHRLIFKTIPIYKRELKLKLNELNKFSKNYLTKKRDIKQKLDRSKIYLKELTQESFDAFIYSAVTNAIIGIIFILMFSYFPFLGGGGGVYPHGRRSSKNHH